MKKKLSVSFSLLLIACVIFTHKNMSAQIIGINELKPLLSLQSDSTYIINFWATWCGPCVKELPHFEEIGKKYTNEKLSIIYVSLDLERQYQTVLLPFIEKHNLSHKVLLLNEPDPNSWIDTVDPVWQGSIPATLIYNDTKRAFYEKPFDFNTLDSTVSTFFINQ